MTVYVDSLAPTLKSQRWRHTEGCHLYADSDEELHVFAERMDLKRCWFHRRRHFHHYDLTKTKRALAVALGAIETDRHHVVATLRKRRANAIRTQ